MKVIIFIYSLIYTYFSGNPPSIEKPYGQYPLYVTNIKNKAVPIVQAYANTKYIGKLVLKFNSNGDLVSIDGKPTLLNHEAKQGYNSIYVHTYIYNISIILNLK